MMSSPSIFVQRAVAFSATLVLIVFLILFLTGNSSAKVTGACSNCHTMHNSQGGSEMSTYGPDGKPWKTDEAPSALLRGTCLGCHGQGGTEHIKNDIPKVYHTASTDLASGNFAYILGEKGEEASDAKGHNVIEIGSNDGTLWDPPGAIHGNMVEKKEFTCAGENGCHGNRIPQGGWFKWFVCTKRYSPSERGWPVQLC